MGSIPPSEPSKVGELRRRIDECAPQLEDAAHQEAYELRLPWEFLGYAKPENEACSKH
jgi:hypothetical protein